MDDLYGQMAEILEVESVAREDELNEFDTWDSLGFLSVISMVDELYQVVLTDVELKSVSTIGELEDLILHKKQE